MVEKFLGGNLQILNLNIPIFVFPNDKKKKGSKEPDFNICVKVQDGEKTALRKVGALWHQEKRIPIVEEEIEISSPFDVYNQKVKR